MTEVKKAEEQQAAKPPARKYEVVKPGETVERCAYILPNRCQCWKAGEERVIEQILHPEKDGPKERTYQFCERHVRIQRAIDAGVMAKESVETTLGEQTAVPPDVPAEVAPPEKEGKKPEKEEAKDSGKEEDKDKQAAKEESNKAPVGGSYNATSPATSQAAAAHSQSAGSSGQTNPATGGVHKGTDRGQS